MMKLLKKSTCMLTVVLALNACKKKDPSPGLGSNYIPPVRTTIMSHSWVVSDVLLNDTSIFAMVQDCEKDNIYTFKDNNVVNVDEGPSRCNPSDPQNSDEVWKLVDDDHKMIFYNDTVEILEVDSKFRFARTDGTDKYEIRMAAKP